MFVTSATIFKYNFDFYFAKNMVPLFQVDQNPEDDSDDLTTISEADEEISSKIFVIKTKSKQQGHYIEDSSSGPSDGEVYRLPFDAIRNTDQGGIQFQTIEEMENEDMSARSRRGLISPSSARSKGISSNRCLFKCNA